MSFPPGHFYRRPRPNIYDDYVLPRQGRKAGLAFRAKFMSWTDEERAAFIQKLVIARLAALAARGTRPKTIPEWMTRPMREIMPDAIPEDGKMTLAQVAATVGAIAGHPVKLRRMAGERLRVGGHHQKGRTLAVIDAERRRQEAAGAKDREAG